jgi:hypothetical protein
MQTMKHTLIIMVLVSTLNSVVGQSDIQSINHLPVEEGGTPTCINTIYAVQFPKCIVYRPGLKTSQIVTRLWNQARCTNYEPLRYDPDILSLQFTATENFKTVNIKVRNNTGKVFNGRVLVHKQSKTSCNAAPRAVNDHIACSKDSTVKSHVGKNDTDEDGDFLSFNIQSQPAHAAIFQLHADGSFTYSPQKGFMGTDSFRYRVTDGLDISDATAIVTVAKYHVELHLAPVIAVGCPRAPLELIALAPAHEAATVRLSIAPNSPAVSVWDAATDGNRLQRTTWKYGSQPSFVWLDASGATQVNATAELLVGSEAKAKDSKNASIQNAWPRSWSVPGGNPGGTHGISRISQVTHYSFDLEPKIGLHMSDVMEALNQAAQKRLGLAPNEQGAFIETPVMAALNFGHSAEGKSAETLATNQCSQKKAHSVWRVEITPIPETVLWTDSIILPVWNQRMPFDKKLTRASRTAWDNFSKALRIHENSHKRIFEAFVEDYLRLANAFAKTKFIGEALSLGCETKQTAEAKFKAGEMAIASFDSALHALNTHLTTLREAYDKAQVQYDSITRHGETQSQDPFTQRQEGNDISTAVDGDILLLPLPRSGTGTKARSSESARDARTPAPRKPNSRK